MPLARITLTSLRYGRQDGENIVRGHGERHGRIHVTTNGIGELLSLVDYPQGIVDGLARMFQRARGQPVKRPLLLPYRHSIFIRGVVEERHT